MSDKSQDPQKLIGTWKQMSGMVEEEGQRPRSNLSTAPNGFMSFMADGRMVNLTTDSSRKAATHNPPTDEEAAHLHRTLIGYAGWWRVEGDQVFYDLDVSWNQSWTGTEQMRYWRLEGDDTLHVSTAPMINPLTGKMSRFRLVFERVKERPEI